MAEHWFSILGQRWHTIPRFYVQLVVINIVLVSFLFLALHSQVNKVHEIEQNFRQRNHDFTAKLLKIVDGKGLFSQKSEIRKPVLDKIDGIGPSETVDLLKLYPNIIKKKEQ